MINFILVILLSVSALADTKISQLPPEAASATTSIDVFPFVDVLTETTKKMNVWDLLNLPPFQSQFSLMIPSQGSASGQCLKSNGTNTLWAACNTGVVTSVGLADISSTPIFTITNSPVTTTGTLDMALMSQSAHNFLAGPSSGSAVPPNFRAIVGSDLPNPSPTSLGGAESITAVSHDFLTTLSTSGVFSQAQPAFIDISGTATAAQIPTPTATSIGGVESISTVSHNFVTGISTSGVASLAQPAFTDVSGQSTLAQLANIGSNTILGNNTGGSTTPSALTVSQVNTLLGTLSNPMTTGGDIIYGGSSGTPTRLANGTAGQVLQSNGTTLAPSWGTNSIGVNYTTQSSNYSAAIGDYVTASGATTTITLPTAVGNSGKFIGVRFNGTNFTPIVITTTSAQTIDGKSPPYDLYTVFEKVIFVSDGSNWIVYQHDTNTGLIADTTATMQYITFTVTSASATIAATYAPAYVFTVTSANATVGATYTNNGHTYTVAATIAAQTTLVVTGPADPLTSGTLTKATGTGDATITFSAFTGNADIAATTYTIAQTIASQTTLIAAGKPTSVNPNSSGRLVKISGTGDAIITYSSFTGTAVQSIDATATTPVFYGSPTSNSVKWMRFGDKIKINFLFSQTTAGASAGSGDYIFLLPNGIQFNTSIYPAYTTTGAQLTTVAAAAPSMLPTTGKVMLVGGSSYSFYIDAFVYSSNQYRMELLWTGPTGSQVGTSAFAATSLIIYNWTIEAPISGWQP